MLQTSIYSTLFALFGVSQAQDPYGNVTNAVTVYEVVPPLPNYGNPCASRIIVNQEFGNSYGNPVDYSYEPPQECPEFTHVTADLYIASYGYQYDRLMHLYKDGIEMWRPSTPEPVGENITSQESKDLSVFSNLFKSGGLVEFSLDNTLEGSNSGPYYTELKLNFYQDSTPSLLDNSNWFYKDDEPPTNLYAVIANLSTIYQQPASGQAPQLPRNTTRAVLDVFASGNSNEEFWYSNDLSQDSPTRLVQVFVDGKLAGIADPFPVVYTGGLNPDLWQPLLGLKATDVPSYIIDVSPFLPAMWDHETTIEVAVGDGYNDTQGILSNWLISVSLLAWDEAGVEGSGYTISNTSAGSGYPIDTFQNSTFEIEGAFYTHNVSNSASLTFTQRNLSWSGVAAWNQASEMMNNLNITEYDEFVHQYSNGWSQSLWTPANGTNVIEYSRSHYYPLDMSMEETSSGSYKLVSVNRSYDVNVSNNGETYWEKRVQESTDVNGQYTSVTDIYSENYNRHAEAIDGRIVQDTTS